MSRYLALSLGALLCGTAGATATSSSSVRIFESHANPSVLRTTTAFAVNPELGRARVELTIDTTFPEDRPPDIVRVRVPGLAYDAATQTIVYRSADRTVECARVEVRGRGLFTRHEIVPTGRCELTQRHVDVPVDDGFVVEDERRFEVHLKTR